MRSGQTNLSTGGRAEMRKDYFSLTGVVSEHPRKIVPQPQPQEDFYFLPPFTAALSVAPALNAGALEALIFNLAINAQPLEKVKLAQSQTLSREQPVIRACRDDYSFSTSSSGSGINVTI